MRRSSVGFLKGDLVEKLLPVCGVEGRSQRQQLVKCGGQGVNVGSMIHDDSFGKRLFRSHVAERSDQVSGHRHTDVGFDARQTEVGQVQLRRTIKQQIRRA